MTLNKRDVKKMIKDAASNIKYLLQNVIIMQTFLQQQKKKKNTKYNNSEQNNFEKIYFQNCVIILQF